MKKRCVRCKVIKPIDAGKGKCARCVIFQAAYKKRRREMLWLNEMCSTLQGPRHGRRVLRGVPGAVPGGDGPAQGEGRAVKQIEPCGCKEDSLGYLAWHYDAERRHRKGQRQVYCTACRKWRWPDLVGPHAVTLTRRQFDQQLGED